MECLPKRLRGDQTRFTSAITTAMCGFTVGWELRSPEPRRTPRNTLNFAHLSCPQHAGVGLGSRDESDTVPAHGEPTVCRRGLYTHKLPSSEVAGDQCAETGTRNKLGLFGGTGEGRLISLFRARVEKEARDQSLWSPQLLGLSWFLPCKKGLPKASIHTKLVSRSHTPFSIVHNPLGVPFLKEAVEYTRSFPVTLPHWANNSIFKLCYPDSPAELPQGRSNAQ